MINHPSLDPSRQLWVHQSRRETSWMDPSPDSDMDAFLALKQAKTNASNQEEFIDTVALESSDASRVRAKLLRTEEHIVSSVVDNQDGPLSRSVISSTSGKLISPHGNDQSWGPETKTSFHMDERVRNIETHMGIVVSPADRSLLDRIKVLEDKILKIEQFYPQIAAHVFNYGKAEVEASSRPGGRVSKLPGHSGQKKKSRDPSFPENDERTEIVPHSSNHLDITCDLRRRIVELRARLQNSSE